MSGIKVLKRVLPDVLQQSLVYSEKPAVSMQDEMQNLEQFRPIDLLRRRLLLLLLE